MFVTNIYATPLGLDWSSVYHSTSIITTNGSYYDISMSFESQAEAASNFQVEVTYWQDGQTKKETHTLPGSGDINIRTGGGVWFSRSL